jgi:hypothetical protein
VVVESGAFRQRAGYRTPLVDRSRNLVADLPKAKRNRMAETLRSDQEGLTGNPLRDNERLD